MKLIISKEAKQDIKQSADWYNEQKKGLGKQFTQQIRLAPKNIKNNPTLYPTKYNNIRCLKVATFPFLIFYTIENTTITIIAVFHTSKDPAKHP